MVNYLQKKSTRIVIFAVLIGSVAIALSPYLFNSISSAAFVNSELLRIKAPITGEVAVTLPEDGEFIAQDRRYSLLEAVAPDRSRLVQFDKQLDANRELIALLNRQLTELDAREADLKKRVDVYDDAMTRQLKEQIKTYTADLVGCRAVRERMKADRDSAKTLAAKDYLSNRSLRGAVSQYQAQAAACDGMAAQLASAKIALDAAGSNIVLREGMDDAPYSRQQLDRMFLRRQEVEREILDAKSKGIELASGLDAERTRLKKASEYDLVLPAGHVVWTVATSPGTAVAEGQTILELADCNKRFVSVEMSERAVSSVTAGASAQVRLVGSRKWVTGEVTQVVGSAAKRDSRLLAAEIPDPGANRFLVEVALPKGALVEKANSRCQIGRLAEVRFNRFNLANLFGGRKNASGSRLADAETR